MKKTLLITAALLVSLGINAQTTDTMNSKMPKKHKTGAKHKHKGTGKSYAKHNIKVSGDDANAPYEGKNSKANDGVKKNKQRNINYQNTSERLPASDGK
ncbi:MAG: hypothetical protein H0X33_11860 [Taibaiella sp.]|nr:hypothetical protein [Taibaiella sp.]